MSEIDAYLIRLAPSESTTLTIPNPMVFTGTVSVTGVVTQTGAVTYSGAVVFDDNVTFNSDIDLGAAANVILEEAVTYQKGFEVTGGDDSNDRGLDISGACATSVSVTGAFTTGINIAADGTTGLAITSAFSGVNMLSLAGTGSTAGIAISGACGIGLNISGACTTDIQLSEGATINNNAAGELTLTETTILTVGKLAFGGVTDWGIGATGTVIDGTGYDWVSQTVGRVNANLNNTAAAAAYHALSVTANQTGSNSCFGTWTELYVSASVDLTGADNFAAVWGQFEAGATVTLSDTDCFTAGVYANVKAGATLTIASGHCVNGVRAQLEVATSGLSNSGRTAAFEGLVKAGTQDWDYGAYLADCTTGIELPGGMTDGIIISGACSDNGIEISGACTGSAIEIVTGAFGIGLNVNADGTTGIAVAGTFSGTTMLSLAGTATDGINISGICADGIHISAAATTTGLNVSADCVTGITIGAQTTAGITIGATATGIGLAACTTAGLAFGSTCTMLANGTLTGAAAGTTRPGMDFSWTSATTYGAGGDPILGDNTVEGFLQIGDSTTACQYTGLGSKVGIYINADVAVADLATHTLVGGIVSRVTVEKNQATANATICGITSYIRNVGDQATRVFQAQEFAIRGVIYTADDDETLRQTAIHAAIIDLSTVHANAHNQIGLEITLNLHTGTHGGGGESHAIYLDSEETTFVRNTSCIHVNDDNYTYFADFDADGNCGGYPAHKTTAVAGDQHGFIKVAVDGTARYIPLYTSTA